MLHRITMPLLLASCLYAAACARSPQPIQDAPLAHYKYPAATLLGAQYTPGQHYALTIYDEGYGGIQKIKINPSNKNQIGDKQAVADENLIFIDGHIFSYLAFYDDWTIQESVEDVFNQDGELTHTITILYDATGTPVSKTENSVL